MMLRTPLCPPADPPALAESVQGLCASESCNTRRRDGGSCEDFSVRAIGAPDTFMYESGSAMLAGAAKDKGDKERRTGLEEAYAGGKVVDGHVGMGGLATTV